MCFNFYWEFSGFSLACIVAVYLFTPSNHFKNLVWSNSAGSFFIFGGGGGWGGLIGRRALNRIITVIIFNLDKVNLTRHHIWVSCSWATEWQAFEGWLLAYMYMWLHNGLVVVAHWLPRIRCVRHLCTWHRHPLEELHSTSSICQFFIYLFGMYGNKKNLNLEVFW